MTTKDLEAIHTKLIAARSRKKDLDLMKARAEIEAIQRECDAYYDGVADTLKAVTAMLPMDKEETP